MSPKLTHSGNLVRIFGDESNYVVPDVPAVTPCWA
jgi:hypothetical protein